MNIPLWTLIPAIFLLTLIYFAMGQAGHWNYNINDLINGNLLVTGGIGFCYVSKFVYKKWESDNH